MKRICACVVAASAAFSPRLVQARVEAVIHDFNGTNGAYPTAGLIADSAGALYGATSARASGGSGAVFKLAPSVSGWTATRLYDFKGPPDGATPLCDLVADSTGALYGTTHDGGSAVYGTVFKLTPPAPGRTLWTETVLHSFTGTPDGRIPQAGLVLDSAGNLYGTTTSGGANNYGAVFQLTPPATGGAVWTETVIYSFKSAGDGANPYAALIADAKGALFGTTFGGGASGDGTVFKLTPPTPKTGWVETLLYSFGGPDGAEPQARLVMDSKGALYGTTYGGAGAEVDGTAFKLAPPAAGHTLWTETLLHVFTGAADGAHPPAGLTFDVKGALYGVTGPGGTVGGVTNNGTVFKLVRDMASPTGWTEKILHSFTAAKDGANPLGDLYVDANRVLYGATNNGGLVPQSFGTVFTLTQ